MFLILLGMVYEYVDRKLVARYQNRFGPRWFQPLADMFKLLAKEEIIPDGVNKALFIFLPILGVTAALTSALYTPMLVFAPAFSFRGDLILVVYMLSVLTICLGLAGANTVDRFSLVGATRTLAQLFSYEAPFMLTLLGPALAAGTLQISQINAYAQDTWWLILTQPIGFFVALIGFMGNLKLPPFDAPDT